MAETYYLADKVIEEIKAKIKSLEYFDECYGKVQILTEKKDGKEFVFPAVYTDNKTYLPLYFDNTLGNYAFVIVKEPYKYLDYSRNKVNKLKADFSLICWYNSLEATGEDVRNTDEVKNMVAYTLNHASFRNGSVTISEITEDRKKVFEEFTSKEIEEQYLMFPYVALRFNGSLYFTETCVIDGTICPPNYDTVEYETHSSTEAYILAAKAYELEQNHEASETAHNKESIVGIKVSDSPEFKDSLITDLESGKGVVEAEWTWLNTIKDLTAKSILSIISAIIHYIYSIKETIIFSTPRSGETLTNGVILLDRNFTGYNEFAINGELQLSIGSNPQTGGYAEGIITGNGTNSPTLSGITLFPTSAEFNVSNGIKNKFTVIKFQGGVYINWTQMN